MNCLQSSGLRELNQQQLTPRYFQIKVKATYPQVSLQEWKAEVISLGLLCVYNSCKTHCKDSSLPRISTKGGLCIMVSAIKITYRIEKREK